MVLGEGLLAKVQVEASTALWAGRHARESRQIWKGLQHGLFEGHIWCGVDEGPGNFGHTKSSCGTGPESEDAACQRP